jgi:GT2 family glycosyltransferase
VTEDVLHVIVLNWNGEAVIDPCLRSLRDVEDVTLRIIMVDNASTDGSVALVRDRYPEVEIIENGSNLLFAEGNNVGIRRALEAGARYILLLNNDTEVDSRFAAAMLGPLRDEPGVGVVGPKILYFDDPRRIWYGGGDFYPVLGVPCHRNIRRVDGSFHDRRRETRYVSGCALLARREVFEDIGLLDPSYIMYCEDVDFCLRARRAGYRCLYEPDALVYHKVSASSGGGMTPYKLEHRLMSTYRLFARFRPLWWRIALFPVHVVGFVLLLCGLLVGGRWSLARGAVRGVLGIARRRAL